MYPGSPDPDSEGWASTGLTWPERVRGLASWGKGRGKMPKPSPSISGPLTYPGGPSQVGGIDPGGSTPWGWVSGRGYTRRGYLDQGEGSHRGGR